MAVKAVVLDLDGTLIDPVGNPVPGIPEMISEIKALNLQLAVASNQPGASRKLSRAGLHVDLIIDKTLMQGINKGSPAWVDKAAEEFGIERNELVWLGDSDLDMRSAVNASVVYFNAGWSKPQYPYGITISHPSILPILLRECFMKLANWYWECSETDHRGRGIISKAMMDSRGAGIPVFQWELINFLKDGGNPTVGPIRVRDFIMWHLVGSIYGDRFYREVDIWTVYPGSKGGTNKALGPYATLLARLFRDRYIDNIFTRYTHSVDSGEARRQGTQVDFLNQVNTMCLNSEHQARIQGKTIVVVDDFITRGYSCECARNLLFEGGASSVICVNIGKYGVAPQVATRLLNNPWNPFQATQHTMRQFSLRPGHGVFDQNALIIISESYRRFQGL